MARYQVLPDCSEFFPYDTCLKYLGQTKSEPGGKVGQQMYTGYGSTLPPLLCCWGVNYSVEVAIRRTIVHGVRRLSVTTVVSSQRLIL